MLEYNRNENYNHREYINQQNDYAKEVMNEKEKIQSVDSCNCKYYEEQIKIKNTKIEQLEGLIKSLTNYIATNK